MSDIPINQLSDVNLFKKLWNDYKPSDDAIAKLKAVKYFPMSGIASSGRDTLIRQLKLKYPNQFHDLITTTTRKPRINNGKLETNGDEYFFVSEQQFLNKIQNQEMIEWAVIHNQQLSGLDSATLQGIDNTKYIINDIDIAGMLNLLNLANTIKPIFITPPSFSVWRDRLKNRGQIPHQELINRMQSALNEISQALKQPEFYFVINDDLDQTCQQIYAHISEGEELNQDSAREAATDIMAGIRSALAAGDI